VRNNIRLDKGEMRKKRGGTLEGSVYIRHGPFTRLIRTMNQQSPKEKAEALIGALEKYGQGDYIGDKGEMRKKRGGTLEGSVYIRHGPFTISSVQLQVP
jgi:hypothetical protein